MPSESEILAPGMLIAPPSLLDPNFVRSVVLLAVHNDGGALGFVINRAGTLSVGELMSMAGYGESLKRHDAPILIGGPVQPSSVWILARDPVARTGRADVLEVGEHLYVTSSRPALDDFARVLDGREPDPMRRLLLAGYSGWAPGQLEAEIAAGAWLPVALDEDIVLDADLDAKWERAYALQGLTPASVINLRGGGEA
jgi:putative transcriptional regulator